MSDTYVFNLSEWWKIQGHTVSLCHDIVIVCDCNLLYTEKTGTEKNRQVVSDHSCFRVHPDFHDEITCKPRANLAKWLGAENFLRLRIWSETGPCEYLIISWSYRYPDHILIIGQRYLINSPVQWTTWTSSSTLTSFAYAGMSWTWEVLSSHWPQGPVYKPQGPESGCIMLHNEELVISPSILSASLIGLPWVSWHHGRFLATLKDSLIVCVYSSWYVAKSKIFGGESCRKPGQRQGEICQQTSQSFQVSMRFPLNHSIDWINIGYYRRTKNLWTCSFSV